LHTQIPIAGTILRGKSFYQALVRFERTASRRLAKRARLRTTTFVTPAAPSASDEQ
jgi:hypothetical protein